MEYDEVDKIVTKMLNRTRVLDPENQVIEAIEMNEKFLKFAQSQYGTQAIGESYCVRENGEHVDNSLICNLLMNLTNLYLRSADFVKNIEMVLANAVEAQKLLIQRKSEGLDKDTNLVYLSEKNLATIYTFKNDLEKADLHYNACLTAATEYDGPDRASFISSALLKLAMISALQGRIAEETAYVEEGYVVASAELGPVHPSFQEAVRALIESLLSRKEYSRADSYSRINYNNIIDPLFRIDQNSDTVTSGMLQLAKVWSVKELSKDKNIALKEAEEAERVMRKACNIVEKKFGSDSPRITHYLATFAQVLIRLERFTFETQQLLERNVSINVACYGSQAPETTHPKYLLKQFYELREKGMK